MTHPIYDPLLSGWRYVLAAPLAPDEPPLPVVLWCYDDNSGWWRVVGGVTVRWLTEAEAELADSAVGRSDAVQPADISAVLGRLGLTPFDAPPARRAQDRVGQPDASTQGTRGRVIHLRLEPDE